MSELLNGKRELFQSTPDLVNRENWASPTP